MRYLKECHNYLSLKMKYKIKVEQEFPALGRKKVDEDGFEHMVETVENDAVHETVNQEQKAEAKDNILKVNPGDFEYDEVNDTILPKNIKAFDQMIEEHPSVNTLRRDDKRDSKVANLKQKIFDTLKVEEKKKRDLSCESVRSDCSGWGHGGGTSDRDISPISRGETRPRSEGDDEEISKPQKSRRQSRAVLRPPKIVLSQ